MNIEKALSEVKSIINADNIILYFPNVKAKEHRVNLHVSDMKHKGDVDANDETRNAYNLGDYFGVIVVNWMLQRKGLSLDDYVDTIYKDLQMLETMGVSVLGDDVIEKITEITKMTDDMEREDTWQEFVEQKKCKK